MTTDKKARLTAIERELKMLRRQFDKALAVEGTNSVLAAMNRRLLGEIDAYRKNVETLQRQLAAARGVERQAI